MSPPDSLTKTDTKLIGQLRRRLKTNLKLHDALELLLHERRQHHFTASLTSLGSIRDARHERKRKREEQASHDGAAKQKRKKGYHPSPAAASSFDKLPLEL